jgi:hypothetical protein
VPLVDNFSTGRWRDGVALVGGEREALSRDGVGSRSAGNLKRRAEVMHGKFVPVALLLATVSAHRAGDNQALRRMSPVGHRARKIRYSIATALLIQQKTRRCCHGRLSMLASVFAVRS